MKKQKAGCAVGKFTLQKVKIYKLLPGKLKRGWEKEKGA